MTAKEYLNQLRNIEAYITTLMEAKEVAFAQATRSTPSYSNDIKVQSSNQSSRLEVYACRIDELEREIDEEITKLVNLKKEALALIKQIENADYKTILVQRYLNNRPWAYVAAKVYSTTTDRAELDSMIRNTHYMHGRALEKFSYFFMQVL